MTPYMAFLIQPMSELLDQFKAGQGSSELWPAVVETLTKCFIHDEGGKSFRSDVFVYLLTTYLQHSGARTNYANLVFLSWLKFLSACKAPCSSSATC